MSLGVAICEPKVEGESLLLGQIKCSSLLLQQALLACGFEHLFVGHFGAEMPLHPSTTDSIESKLTALDLAFVDKCADPLVGINIEETSGVSRAWLGGDYPPLKLRVHPILSFSQAKPLSMGVWYFGSQACDGPCRSSFERLPQREIPHSLSDLTQGT